MKCVRFEDLRTGNKRIGFIDGDVIRCVYGSLETYWQITDETFAMRDVRWRHPAYRSRLSASALITRSMRQNSV